jgi:transposase-like protein
MTEERMALAELLQKSGDGNFLRSVAEAVLQILMEADVEGLIGAGRHERSGDRLNYRNAMDLGTVADSEAAIFPAGCRTMVYSTNSAARPPGRLRPDDVSVKC